MYRPSQFSKAALCGAVLLFALTSNNTTQTSVWANSSAFSAADTRSAPATFSGKAPTPPPLVGLNARTVQNVTSQSLRTTLDRILTFCAKGEKSYKENPPEPISRANVQVLSRLLAERKSVSLTPDTLKKIPYQEVNALLRGILRLTSDAQKDCLARYSSIGEQFNNPPNACRIRDNEFPVHITYPMWWFAITFNRDDPASDKGAAERRVMTFRASQDGIFREVVKPEFPLACGVGYGEDGHPYLQEIKCHLVSNTGFAPSSVPMQYRKLKSQEDLIYENGTAYFNGTWHIECPVDLTRIIQVSGGNSITPDWNDYSTFWLKASGIPTLNGKEQPFVYFRAHEPSIRSASRRSSAPLRATEVGNIGLSVSFAGPANPPNTVIAQLSNTEYTESFPVMATDTAMQTWGAHVQRQTATGSTSTSTAWYIPDIDATNRVTYTVTSTTSPPLNVPFFPIGTFYVGFDPTKGIHFEGWMDEAIVDPSDSHPPSGG